MSDYRYRAATTFFQFPPTHNVEGLRFTLADLEAVIADLGPGATAAERELRHRLANTRRRVREFC